jgi:hypothetical protein
MDQGRGAGSANQTLLILPGNYIQYLILVEDGPGERSRLSKSNTPDIAR